MENPLQDNNQQTNIEQKIAPKNSYFLSEDNKENFHSVEWRQIVDESFLYINESFYNKRGKDIPESISQAEDDGVIVRLIGLKDLAKRHGYKSITYNPLLLNDENCVICCSITWEPTVYNNFREVVTQGIASGNKENLFGFAAKFKEANASNRAFARAVRDYFCIFSACDAELDESEIAKVAKSASKVENAQIKNLRSNKVLEKTVIKILDIDTFKEFKEKYIRSNMEFLSLDEASLEWNCYEDIPTDICKKMTAHIRKQK